MSDGSVRENRVVTKRDALQCHGPSSWATQLKPRSTLPDYTGCHLGGPWSRAMTVVPCACTSSSHPTLHFTSPASVRGELRFNLSRSRERSQKRSFSGGGVSIRILAVVAFLRHGSSVLIATAMIEEPIPEVAAIAIPVGWRRPLR